MKKLILSIIFACIITFTPSAFALDTTVFTNFSSNKIAYVHITAEQFNNLVNVPFILVPACGSECIIRPLEILFYKAYVAPAYVLPAGNYVPSVSVGLSAPLSSHFNMSITTLTGVTTTYSAISFNVGFTLWNLDETYFGQPLYLSQLYPFASAGGSSFDFVITYQTIGGNTVSSGGGSPMATGDILDFLSSSNFLLGSLFANILVLALLPLLLVVIFIRFIKKFL